MCLALTAASATVGGQAGTAQGTGTPQGAPPGAPRVTAQGVQIPPPTGLVNDFAHVIPPENAAHIEQVAADVRNKSRGEIAVVTLPDIDDRAPSDVALEIGRQWKVGKIGAPGDPTRNAGAIILVVPKEASSDGRGHCFIATGQGTEGFITDADAGDICRAAIPYFRQRDYGTGIELLTDSTAARFAREFHFTVDSTLPAAAPPPAAAPTRRGGLSPGTLFFLLILAYFILSFLARRRGGRGGCLPIIIPYGGGWGRGGGWGGGDGGGGGGGGGFGGFGGGGGFSGGGGGSDW